MTPKSRLVACGSLRLLDAGEIVIGQPTCLIVSGAGFSIDPMSALGSCAVTLEEPRDAAECQVVATASHLAGRRVVSADQTSDAVKTLRLLTQAGGADGGSISFLVFATV